MPDEPEVIIIIEEDETTDASEMIGDAPTGDEGGHDDD